MSRFSKNALKVLHKRYLQAGENPQEMFHRVAVGLARVEKDYGATDEEIEEWTTKFESIISNLEFMPAGRTLANVGAATRVVSNCIVLHIHDSMDEIFGTLHEAALLQKDGSGLGFPFHLLRPAGETAHRSAGKASGPVPFLTVFNQAFGVIKQQNRHGANMAVMRVDHPDILEFIHIKDKEGDVCNFNISVGLTDDFMRAVLTESHEHWLCSWGGKTYKPRRIQRAGPKLAYQGHEEVNLTARELFAEIIESAWKTGEPGCVFLDTVNRCNPLPGLGRLEACNPCGEQFLHDGDVCNLGSINLEKCVNLEERCVDYEKLTNVTQLAVRMLDNVVDVTQFPVEKVNRTSRDNRRIGLGIMGLADMLMLLRVGYNTKRGRDIMSRVMKHINTVAHATSVKLAEEKGRFPNWPKSIYAGPGTPVPMRNAALTNVPPTGTTSMVCGVSGGVEPYFALAYHYENVMDGETLSYFNKHLKAALHEAGLGDREDIIKEISRTGSVQAIAEIPQWIKEVFVTAMDITAEDHIKAQAAVQEYCDNAISKTINFPNTATKDDILRGYLLAWQLGCKGCTVYRNDCRKVQILNLNEGNKECERCVE